MVFSGVVDGEAWNPESKIVLDSLTWSQFSVAARLLERENEAA